MEAMVPERATDVVTEKIPIKEETPKDTVVEPKDPLPHPPRYDSLVAHVRVCLPWWQRHAQPSVVRIIERGVEPNWLRPPALRNPDRHVHTPQELQMTRALMNDEYMPVGAVIKLKSHTGYTVPWFLIVKDDGLGGQKVRLMHNLKKVNAFLHAPKFTLESISKIYPHLRKGMWAASIDLKHAYLHLGLSPSLSKFCTLRVGDDYYRFVAAPFGLAHLPYFWDRVIKTFENLAHRQGYLVFFYFDDILVLGHSPMEVRRIVAHLLEWFQQAGLLVNIPKSHLEPVQNLIHLGVELDFVKGCVSIPARKLKSYRKELGKLVTHNMVTCRRAAAILGQVKSLLIVIPALRSFLCLLQAFVQQASVHGWDTMLPVPTEVREELRLCKDILLQWPGRYMLGRAPTRRFASDASTHAYGGLDLRGHHLVHGYWRHLTPWHINLKEVSAAMDTIRAMARKGDLVKILVDNTVALSYLTKQGGKKLEINRLMRPFLLWAMENQVTLQVEWVPSQDMPADCLSRWDFDSSEVELNKGVYLSIKRILWRWCQPTHDMWASPQTAKETLFVTHWPHAKATAVDARYCPLQAIKMSYACPPWAMIPAWI